MKRITAWFLTVLLCISVFGGCGTSGKNPGYDKGYIHTYLNMKNREDLFWQYRAEDNVWILSPCTAVAYPTDAAKQSISIAIPEAYVEGIDTDQDGVADITTDNFAASVAGQLIIRSGRVVNSSTGYEYHSGNAPILFRNKSVYGEATEAGEAETAYASEGYITVSCGNRGTSPEGLADLKNAVLFLKYNIALGNLPGAYSSIVSSGGMLSLLLAATGHSKDFYSAQADAGAIGVFREANGAYTFPIEQFPENLLTDHVWGCIVCDPVISLYSGELFAALERTMNPEEVYASEFQRNVDEYLAYECVTYLNDQKLIYNEAATGYDLNENGELEDMTCLLLEKDHDHSVWQNGYFGSYMNYYLSILNEPYNIPDQASLEAMNAMLELPEAALSETESIPYETYQEMTAAYEAEAKDFYREGIQNLYCYNPLYYVGADLVEGAKWVRFLDNPMTSSQPIFSALTMNAAWNAAGTDSEIHMVWDTDLAVDQLERKYIPSLIDQMVSGTGEETEAPEQSLNNIILPGLGEGELPLTDEPADSEESGEEAEEEKHETGIKVSLSLADAVRFESARTAPVPRYDTLASNPYRAVFDPKGEGKHYDVFLLKVLQKHEDVLEPLFDQLVSNR